MQKERTYLAIDLKSFFASAECVARGLDPLNTNLVVADVTRTEKTICLAVSPSLKAYGIPGRARLFEVVSRMKEVNADRLRKRKGKKFEGGSYLASELASDPSLKAEYIAAPPRMSLYLGLSTKIYNIYKKFVSADDIVVYSVDEVFIDATDYLKLYRLTAHDFAMKLILAVLEETGITATAGIGTNLYLSKIALDIGAKHVAPDRNGVRISFLDETLYRQKLWEHEPITDFWRVGKGYAERLAAQGLKTMGDVARCSLGQKGSYYSEDLLYKIFGVNAELMIDHAWGYEPCTISDIKAYKPINTSISSGQVLQEPYPCDLARLIVKEMTDSLALDLVCKKLVSDQLVLVIGYDAENVKNGNSFAGEIKTDRYGRKIPKEARGTENIGFFTSSGKVFVEAAKRLFDRIADPSLTVRRINVCATHLYREGSEPQSHGGQISLFEDVRENEDRKEELEKEKTRQEAVLAIREKYGKNALLKGMNFEKGATGRARNKQIGGHKE